FESDLEPRGLGVSGRVAGPRLWHARRPAAAVARLFMLQALFDNRGRFLVAAPAVGVTVVALAARLFPALLPDAIAAPGPWRSLVDLSTLPIVAWFPAMAVALSGDLWANQFGGDGHGVKILFSLPLSARELVLGKLLGVARIALLQNLLALPALLLIGPAKPLELLHGIGAGGAATVFL